MDREGWIKTKKGKRVYDRPFHELSQEDLKRMARKFLQDPNQPDRVLDWFNICAEIFETIVVDRFRSVPWVSQAWDAIYSWTLAEHLADRPLTFQEQINFMLERLRDTMFEDREKERKMNYVASQYEELGRKFKKPVRKEL